MLESKYIHQNECRRIHHDLNCLLLNLSGFEEAVDHLNGLPEEILSDIVSNCTMHVNLCNQTPEFSRQPVISDKNVWSQSISVN